MCLEYHPKDAAPCNRLRDAYRADLRAYLESLRAVAGSVVAATVSAFQKLWKSNGLVDFMANATASIAVNTLQPQTQLLVAGKTTPKALTDQELRALADQSRAEAIYWYKYMQGLERAYPESGREPQSAPPARGTNTPA